MAERKRHRDDADETPRRPKKTKDLAVQEEGQDGGGDDTTASPKKAKKVKKEGDDGKRKEKHSSKHEKKVKKEKSRDADHPDTAVVASPTDASSSSSSSSTAFPFFTQTVSLWVPLYPVGFDRPLTSAAHQHLEGLLNHYSPLLGGYLLAYRNVNLGDKAARANPHNPPTDATPATLASVDEYAVGFGWLTADVDLFVPRRGARLEGKVVLQNEGALGVSCWDKFNASIEAARLPAGWRYVDGEEGEEQQAQDADGGGEEEMASSGHWVDETGTPVAGTLQFRIKEFDVGLAGDHGYLAIEGTLLSPADERRLVLQERARKRGRGDRLGGSGGGMRGRRALPEFAITQFGGSEEAEEETAAPPVEVYKGSRPGTPGD